MPPLVYSGSLDSPAPPGSATSAMFTIEDIFNRLGSGTAGVKRSDAFLEPSATPASTGHTTDEVMAKAPAVDDTNGAVLSNVTSGKTFWGLTGGAWGLGTGTAAAGTSSASVAKTGQTAFFAAGDDGDLEKGVTWPNPRFTDNTDGTVTDNLTTLIWLTNANCFAGRTWEQALGDANGLASGSCGLTDNSSAGDWRLPNVKELQSLIDFSNNNPSLPAHPFTTVLNDLYWSSTTSVSLSTFVWVVGLHVGVVGNSDKTDANFVWPVRGGQ